MLQKTLSLDPAHILAVDDDELVRYHYQHLLSSNGYEVELAKDAEEAFRLLEQQSFDLILLDLRMPGMGGMEFLRRLRKQSQVPEVLVVSGYARVEDAVEAGRLGVFNVIEKPCRPGKLLEEIQRILEFRRDPLISYVRTHYDTIGSCKEVADLFHIDLKTLSNRTKRVVGQSFYQFLQACRIQEAQRLLTETDLEVTPDLCFGQGKQAPSFQIPTPDRRQSYLAVQNISKKWTMSIPNWKVAPNQFAILFEGTNILHTATNLTVYQLYLRGCGRPKFRLCPFAVYLIQVPVSPPRTLLKEVRYETTEPLPKKPF